MPDFIRQQEVGLGEFLNEAIDAMRSEEQRHREQFRDVSLAAILKGADYDCGKVAEGTIASEPSLIAREKAVASGFLEGLYEKAHTFQQRLRERHEGEDPGWLSERLPRLEYLHGRLSCFLQPRCDSERPDAEAARIFAEELCRKFRDLRNLAQKIDAEYQTDT